MFKKINNFLMSLLILTYLFFEELIWEKIVVKIYNIIAKLKLYEPFISYIKLSANRYAVLVFFILPFVAGEILGIASAILATKMHIFLAVLVYTVKIPIVVLAFSILKNGKDKLNSFAWFAIAYSFTEKIITRIKNSNVYIRLKDRIYTIKQYLYRIRNRLLNI